LNFTIANLTDRGQENFRAKVIAVALLLLAFNAAAWLWAMAKFAQKTHFGRPSWSR
jgi:hypothetical protein